MVLGTPGTPTNPGRGHSPLHPLAEQDRAKIGTIVVSVHPLFTFEEANDGVGKGCGDDFVDHFEDPPGEDGGEHH